MIVTMAGATVKYLRTPLWPMIIGALAMIQVTGCDAQYPVLTAAGLGVLSGQTSFDQQAIGSAFPEYQINQATYYAEGLPAPVFEIRDRSGVLLAAVLGDVFVKTILITDPRIVVAGKAEITIGSPYTRYDADAKAFGLCVPGMEEISGAVVCTDGAQANIRFLFKGAWGGPDGILPPTDILAHYRLSMIHWIPLDHAAPDGRYPEGRFLGPLPGDSG